MLYLHVVSLERNLEFKSVDNILTSYKCYLQVTYPKPGKYFLYDDNV